MLFGPPGFAYVYFIYGMHYCLNFSCQPDGNPGGVLIRALDPVEGLKTMARLRGFQTGAKPELLTSGPGRLCQALGITRANGNGLDVTARRFAAAGPRRRLPPAAILPHPASASAKQSTCRCAL